MSDVSNSSTLRHRTDEGTIMLPRRIPALHAATVKLNGFAKRPAKVWTMERATYREGRKSGPTAYAFISKEQRFSA